MTTRNKDIVLAAYAALNAGDAAGYFDHMSDDVRLTFFGSHRLAGTFHGKHDIMQNFVPLISECLAGPIRLHIHNLVADGEHVVVEGVGEARSRDGRDYNNHYCIWLTLKDGWITDVREYMDTELTRTIFG